MIKKYNGISPDIDKSAFVAENATIVGKVSIAEKASIWYGAVLRADGDSIYVGARSNVQDNAVVHVDSGSPVVIGENVTIGHAAIIHSCKIESNCLIGMGAIILNGAVIGEGSIVGAGALVTKNSVIPPNSMVVGFPAKVKRELTDEEQTSIYEATQEYIELAENTER